MYLKLLDENDWKSFAEEEGLFYAITGYFSQDEPMEEFDGDIAVNHTVFSAKSSEASEPLRIKNGYILFRIPDLEQKYEEITGKIKSILEDKRIKDLVDKKAEEILFELKEGKTAEEVAGKYSLEVKESKYFSRNGFIEGIGSAPYIARAAFSTAQDSWNKVNSVGGEIFVIRTVDTRQPSEEKFQDKKKDIASLLLNQKKQEFFMDWVEDLEEKNHSRTTIFWEELK